jgi:hypothetical protein
MGPWVKLGLGFKGKDFMFYAFLDQPIMLFPFLQKCEAHVKLMMFFTVVHQHLWWKRQWF